MHCSFPHQLQNKLKKHGKRPKPPNTACHRTAEGISSVPGLVKVRFYLEKTHRLSRSRQQKKMECEETKSSQLGNSDHHRLIWRETILTPNQMMSLTLKKWRKHTSWAPGVVWYHWAHATLSPVATLFFRRRRKKPSPSEAMLRMYKEEEKSKRTPPIPCPSTLRDLRHA